MRRQVQRWAAGRAGAVPQQQHRRIFGFGKKKPDPVQPVQERAAQQTYEFDKKVQAGKKAAGWQEPSFLASRADDPKLQEELERKMRDRSAEVREKYPEKFGFQEFEEEKDAAYMRPKEARLGQSYAGVADISSQHRSADGGKTVQAGGGAAKDAEDAKDAKTSAREKALQASRSVAIDMNPFGGETQVALGQLDLTKDVTRKQYMDYVEQSQDYYEQGQSDQQLMMMSRKASQKKMMRTASAMRTHELLGPSSQNSLTPQLSRETQDMLFVNHYDMHSFRLSDGRRVVGSFILYQNQVFLWDVGSVDDITMEKMTPIAHMFPVPKFIVIGTGYERRPLHPDIHMYMRTRGTRIDTHSTRSAIGTWHWLAEDRVQAALVCLPMDNTNGFDFPGYNKFWRKRKADMHDED